jgi:hypothetical protein
MMSLSVLGMLAGIEARLRLSSPSMSSPTPVYLRGIHCALD